MGDKGNPGLGRRRTLNRIVGASGLLHANRKQTQDVKQTSDTNSDAFNKSNLCNVRLENTYRIHPSENQRFESGKVERLIKDVLESRLSNAEYDHDLCIVKSKELAAEIQQRVKEFQWKRYKLICNVTIGQYTRQGINVVSRFVWDDKLDSYSCVKYNNKSLFAVAQCYGVYFE